MGGPGSNGMTCFASSPQWGRTDGRRTLTHDHSEEEVTLNIAGNDKLDTKTFEMQGKCPFGGDRIGGAVGSPPTLSDWYPNRLKVEFLHQNGPQANPLGEDFDYKAAFETLDLDALKRDIKAFLTTSVAW